MIQSTSRRIPTVEYNFRDDEYWRDVPRWKNVDVKDFGNHTWQQQNCIKSTKDVSRTLGNKVHDAILEDINDGLAKTPMNVRITPYLFAMIDWSNPYDDPIRRQFLPMGSQFLDNHPQCMDDSLGEEEDSVVPYLTHRYPDKVLFLPTSVCPVYCTYCTRSRLVGGSTATKEKSTYGPKKPEWDPAFEYIRNHPEIEDVVISGGDMFMMPPATLSYIGVKLLEIPHVRRLRFATKGLAVSPMRVTEGDHWSGAIASVASFGRERMKEVCIHTHISTETEITDWTHQAMQRLTSLGVKVRNQCVLLRGVNDNFDTMYRTLKKLSYLNIQPYIVYVHDMVPGCEHLRTTLAAAETMSKELLGTSAGFNTPRFVCDAPNGGGKREISSFEAYDRELGVSAWTAPRVKPGEVFYYFDPIDQLPAAGQAIWGNEVARERRLADFRRQVESSLGVESHAIRDGRNGLKVLKNGSNNGGPQHVIGR